MVGKGFAEILNDARRLTHLPDEAYRKAHPDVDESWYAEDWVDTRRSQEVLQYQRYTAADHVAYMRKTMPISGWLIAPLFPLIKPWVLGYSPYWKEDTQQDPTPLVEVFAEQFKAAPRGSA